MQAELSKNQSQRNLDTFQNVGQNIFENPSISKYPRIKSVDNLNVLDQSYSKIHNNVCLKTGTPNFYRYYPVRIFSLLSGVDANNNYYHWFFDSLSRILIYKKFYKIKKNDFFLVHNLKHDFQIQSLKLFEIKNFNPFFLQKFFRSIISLILENSP